MKKCLLLALSLLMILMCAVAHAEPEIDLSIIPDMSIPAYETICYGDQWPDLICGLKRDNAADDETAIFAYQCSFGNFAGKIPFDAEKGGYYYSDKYIEIELASGCLDYVQLLLNYGVEADSLYSLVLPLYPGSRTYDQEFNGAILIWQKENKEAGTLCRLSRAENDDRVLYEILKGAETVQAVFIRDGVVLDEDAAGSELYKYLHEAALPENDNGHLWPDFYFFNGPIPMAAN